MIDQVQEVKDRVDIVEVISTYLTMKKAGANFKVACPFHNEKTPSMMISPERQTFKCFGCFPAGQLAETADGLKEIQTLVPGDHVYTSKASLEKVNLLFEREYEGDLLEISTRMVTEPIKITGDHNVFVIKTKNCKQASRESRLCQRNCNQNCPTKYFLDYKLEKVQARTLKINDCLLYPIKSFDKIPNQIVDLIEYTGQGLKRGLKPRQFNQKVNIDENFARLSGLYIAEGSNHRAYIRFSFGSHEMDFANEVVFLIKEIFGLDSSIHQRKAPKNGIEVTCCNSILSRVFAVLFGKGSNNKKIPKFFFNSPTQVLEKLIEGIVDGDGFITKDQEKCRGGRISIKVISRTLVHQIKDILLSWNMKPSINYTAAHVSVDKVSHKDSWCISWYDQVQANYSDIQEIDGIKYWLLPIRSIKKSIYNGLVYNLNINNEHSYLTSSFMVANCGEGGDVITFIEKIEGLDFYNALKLLAEKAGVKLKTDSVKFGDKEFKADKKTRLFEINEWAKKVYHKLLVDHPKADRARKYLDGRGMKKETVLCFEIGYAPVSWDFLLRFLKSKGYTEQEAVDAGVAIKAEQGKVYDRFRGRIIFPISNIMGNTVAFTSRILEDDGKSAKYINSAETPIYIKGKTIYGLDKAKLAIKEKDLAIMVEGNMDVIACHQAGFKNVVATSGTALTLDQLIILTRYAKTIAFCFDSDNAGQTAMKRSIRLAMQNDVSIKIISTMPFKDADEAIKADPKNWEKSVKAAKPALEYWINELTDKKELDVNDKKSVAKEILPVIKIIFSDIEKEHYIKYLSEKLGTSEQALIDALEKSKRDVEFTKDKKQEELREEKKMTVLERIIGLVWAEPAFCQKLQKQSVEFVGFSKELEPIIDMIKAGEIIREKIKPEVAAVYDQLSISALLNVNHEEEGAIKEEIEYLLGRLRSDQKETIKEQFAKKIKAAEVKGDKAELKKLLLEFSTLIK